LPDLKGKIIAILGGDARETILAERLSALGIAVRVLGLPVRNENIITVSDVAGAVEGAAAIILPVPGINDQRQIYSAFVHPPFLLEEDVLKGLPPGTPVLVGMARPLLRDMVLKYGLKLIEVMKIDEVAILNSIPSAEGAIQMAMENTEITIHGSRCAVLGFGRTGMTLSRSLAALGAKTTVVARKPEARARAREMGLAWADFTDLASVLTSSDIIFNTVPRMVLDSSMLAVTPCQAVIIDLASSPGGTDFEAARDYGIKALLAPGLPGRVAPKTAGNILAEIIPGLLITEITS